MYPIYPVRASILYNGNERYDIRTVLLWSDDHHFTLNMFDPREDAVLCVGISHPVMIGLIQAWSSLRAKGTQGFWATRAGRILMMEKLKESESVAFDGAFVLGRRMKSDQGEFDLSCVALQDEGKSAPIVFVLSLDPYDLDRISIAYHEARKDPEWKLG